MLIYVMGWVLFGVGVFMVGGRAFSLTQDRKRPIGRHADEDDRTTPEEMPEEWQSLRLLALTTLIVPFIFMSQAAKASAPWQAPVKGVVVVATAVLLIWEVRSWRQITLPGARRRAVSRARWFLIPTMLQVLGLFHVWSDGVARVVVLVVAGLLVVGPDVEPWIRRQLIRRAGGSTPEVDSTS